jgi:hypothetical protein
MTAGWSRHFRANEEDLPNDGRGAVNRSPNRLRRRPVGTKHAMSHVCTGITAIFANSRSFGALILFDVEGGFRGY